MAEVTIIDKPIQWLARQPGKNAVAMTGRSKGIKDGKCQQISWLFFIRGVRNFPQGRISGSFGLIRHPTGALAHAQPDQHARRIPGGAWHGCVATGRAARSELIVTSAGFADSAPAGLSLPRAA
ncbi:hypothetical protein [Pseudoduganella lurida]|uniref:hypothetical protein n=1 Tax=Pseudoduganella lurida TaxID=1036180 RepID=UPI00119E4FD8|nr:hypothetical protein [Pseudoduganella lurida]